MTHQIIYSSESATPMQKEDLDEILEDARRRNAANNITGALIYVEGVFLQILEGERGVVKDLMVKIAKDVRHESVTVLLESEVPTAAFKDWKMAYVSATAEQVAKWAGLGGTSQRPATLGDLRQDPQKATLVVHGILALLGSEEPGLDKPR